MDRKTFILATLKEMTVSDMHVVVDLDIDINPSGTAGHLVWKVESVGNSIRSVILLDLKEAVTEAYEADAVDAHDEATVLPWVEDLRRDARPIDYLLLGNAQRITPLVSDYAAGYGPDTTIEEMISDAVQEVYDMAAQQLVRYLENQARNNRDIHQVG